LWKTVDNTDSLFVGRMVVGHRLVFVRSVSELSGLLSTTISRKGVWPSVGLHGEPCVDVTAEVVQLFPSMRPGHECVIHVSEATKVYR
jgi:hypothetical protein